MKRRRFLSTTVTAVLSGATLVAMPRQSSRQSATQTAGENLRQAVIDGCADCVKTGRACMAMCDEMLRHGMTAMAACQMRVVEMVTMCEAMARMAATNTAPAARLKALAALCADTCRDCESACRPQSAAHAECKACMDDAARCAKACDAYKAS